MKNIHVLPTDKPSRLYFNHNKGFEKYQFSKEPFINGLTNTTNQHIYITSDEEIKQVDWVFDIELDRIKKCQYSGTFRNWKKIILTTDPDLITEGVQAIDDEFLEWFVKNLSCEEVKIEDYGNLYNFRYLVLIPQEEPKSIHEQIIEHCGGEEKFKEIAGLKPKQETLEEAAEKYAEEENSCYTNDYYGFIKGAKWQAERMYSEEDMKQFAEWLIKINFNYTSNISDIFLVWKKQFKKQK
jgi:hypothetical protein